MSAQCSLSHKQMKAFIKNIPIFSRVSTILNIYPRNLRRRILRSIILMIVSFLLVFVGFEIVRYRAVKRNTAQNRIDQIQEQIERTFFGIRGGVEESLFGIQEFGQKGEIDLSDQSSLNRFALFVLSKILFIPSLQIANDQGTEYLIYGDPMTWQTRLVNEGNPAEGRRWQGTTVLDEWEKKLEYDPRSQVWYQRAITSSQSYVSWNLSSLMPDRDDVLGISGAIHWESSETVYVAVLNIPLEELLRLMAIFSGNAHGSIFWLTADGKMSSASGMKRPIRSNIQESLFSSATDPVAEIAIQQFIEQWETRDSSASDFFYSSTVENIPWRTEARRFTVDRQSFWLGVTVPEQELLPQIERRQNSILSQIIISTVILAIVLLAILLRFIMNTTKDIKGQEADIGSAENALREMIQRGESRKLEFKSTIRWNLKTEKPGKEIEIAWLKTVVAYLNSEGGHILIGVKDDGELLGLATDNFKNDDKLLLHVNNLLKQHIGLEFSQFISVELQSIDDKQVLIIYCETAKMPVFLKHHNDEQFYIRTGPSSIKLSGSEMLKYLEHRPQKS